MLDLHPHLNCQSGVVRLKDVAQYMPEYGLGDFQNQNPRNNSERKSCRKRNKTFQSKDIAQKECKFVKV